MSTLLTETQNRYKHLFIAGLARIHTNTNDSSKVSKDLEEVILAYSVPHPHIVTWDIEKSDPKLVFDMARNIVCNTKSRYSDNYRNTFGWRVINKKYTEIKTWTFKLIDPKPMIAVGIVSSKYDFENGVHCQFYKRKGTFGITLSSSSYTKYSNGSFWEIRYFMTGIKPNTILNMTLNMIDGILTFDLKGKEVSIQVDIEQEYVMAFSLRRQQKIQLLQ